MTREKVPKAGYFCTPSRQVNEMASVEKWYQVMGWMKESRPSHQPADTDIVCSILGTMV